MKEERDRLIREYVEKGYRANRIQRELQHRGLGMRRKDLLAQIRGVKGVKKKPESYKYTPRKYRRILIPRPEPVKIAIYGSVRGRPRRIQLIGYPQDLYYAVIQGVKHPPKQQFLTSRAGSVALFPSRYLDVEEEWDDRPRVES